MEKRPALKKYGDVRPDLSVKEPKVRILAERIVCKKACLKGGRGDFVVAILLSGWGVVGTGFAGVFLVGDGEAYIVDGGVGGGMATWNGKK